MFARMLRGPCLLSVMLLAGCVEILNTHSTGNGPAGPGALPGPPAGDSISSVGDVSYNGGNIMLNYLPGAPPPAVELVPGGKPHETATYFVSFSGIRTTITALPILAVEAIDDQSRVACALEIAGGELRLVGGEGAVVADTYSINADEHRVLLRIDKRIDRCFVTITQVPQGTDGPPIEPAVTADVPFIDPGFDEMDHVRVHFLQDSDSAAHYFLGPVRITKQD